MAAGNYNIWIRVITAIGLFIFFLTWEPGSWAQTPPNIILIVTDDQRWDTLSFMPTVQRELLDKGVEFTNAFVTTPLCCPSRASTLTGQYAHNHGALTNGLPEGGLFNDASTIATWLQTSGYRTALLGKYLNFYSLLPPMVPDPVNATEYVSLYIPPGWSDWEAFANGVSFYYNYVINDNGSIVGYRDGVADYSTDVLATRAINFIQSSASQPFFLYFAPFAPHSPRTPAPRHSNLFSDLTSLRPPNFNEADIMDKPAWVQALEPLSFDRQSRLDSIRREALQTLQAVDDAVASMLQVLRNIGQEDNTVIIYTSDNGLSWGEHRWVGKGCPYEECIHVPFVVRYPGLITVPRKDDHIVLNIDFAPTLAEITGAPLIAKIDGMSILPLLTQTTTLWREDFLVEYWPRVTDTSNSYIPEYGAIRTSRWKYAEYISGERELYNLVDDPYELNNVAGQAHYNSIVAILEAQLQGLKATGKGIAPILISNDPLPAGSQEVSYLATIGVSGGVGPYSWKLVAGTLPDGVVLDPTSGLISGTPRRIGDFVFTVQVTDSQMSWDTKVLNLHIDPNTGLPTNREVMVNVTNDQRFPCTDYNQVLSEYLIAWTDGRRGVYDDIYAVRMDTGGNLIGPDIPISTAVQHQRRPAMKAGGGGYLVAWVDYRNFGTNGPDIYGAWVGPNGVVGPEMAICACAGNQYDPVIGYDPVGNTFLVNWIDGRGTGTGVGAFDLWGAVIPAGGTTAVSPFPVVVEANAQRKTMLGYDHANNQYYMIWNDLRNGVDYDLYGSRVTPSGTVLDGMGSGVLLVSAPGNQLRPFVTDRRPLAGINYFLAAWTDYRYGATADIYGMYIDGNGNPVGPEFAISADPAQQANAVVALDWVASKKALVSWMDVRNGVDYDIYGTWVDQADGIWGDYPIVGQPSNTLDEQQAQMVVYATDGVTDYGFLAVWMDRRNGGDYDIYGKRIFP